MPCPLSNATRNIHIFSMPMSTTKAVNKRRTEVETRKRIQVDTCQSDPNGIHLWSQPRKPRRGDSHAPQRRSVPCITQKQPPSASPRGPAAVPASMWSGIPSPTGPACQSFGYGGVRELNASAQRTVRGHPQRASSSSVSRSRRSSERQRKLQRRCDGMECEMIDKASYASAPHQN